MKKYYFSILLVLFVSCSNKLTNTKLAGSVFGTFCEVTYANNGNNNYQRALDSIFEVVNQSMSNYLTDSDISKVNNHKLNIVDNNFVGR